MFLPGKVHGHSSLMGWGPWGCKESDTTAQWNQHHWQLMESLCKENGTGWMQLQAMACSLVRAAKSGFHPYLDALVQFTNCTIPGHETQMSQYWSRSHTLQLVGFWASVKFWHQERLEAGLVSLVASKHVLRGFPSSSASKESARNAGDPSSIPGSGKATGEGIGYPLSILAWRIPWTV